MGVLRLAGLILAVCAGVTAQSLVEPERIPAVREQFASAASAARLRCTLTSIRPTLAYDLQFHAGYTIDVPLNQLAGSGHKLTVLLRVTPEGGQPVYLGKSESLAEIPNTRLEGELTGAFLVGEGSYAVDALAHDESGRVCSSKWRLQARRSAGERGLEPALDDGVVRPLAGGAPARRAEPGSVIPRVTILLHAAPMRPGASKLEPATQSMLVDSLSSLLKQLPANSVRLVVFNLQQQVVLLQNNNFTVANLQQVTDAFDQLQLARVDVRTLENRDKLDVLSDLVDKEVRESPAASMVILIAPRSASHVDASLQRDPQRFATSHWYYLQYQHLLFPAGGIPGRGVPDPSQPEFMGMPGRGGRGPMTGRSAPAQPPDPTEQFFHRIKGQAFAIRRPEDLAEAIQRMRLETPATARPAPPAPADVGPPASNEPKVPTSPAAHPEQLQPAKPDQPELEENPVEVLIQLRDQVLEHARAIPNHMCVESMERDRFEPSTGRLSRSCANLLASRHRSLSSLRLNTRDWLRLDVGVGNGTEIFSWAGAIRFDDRELDEIVPEGAIGTGAFATLLISIFQNRDAKFTFDGAQTVSGRRMFAYSFAIPQEQSGYRVKTRQKTWIITGYSGELLVDPKTAALIHLTVRTDELPESTSSCEIDTTLEYGMVPLAGFDYLLPKATRQRFIGREGDEAENRIAFSACREYRGESTLTFGTTSEGLSGRAPRPDAATLSAGLPVAIELAKPIPFQGSAAGDRIEGRISDPIVDPQTHAMIAPRGAKVEGRLMRLELRTTPPDFSVALRWDMVEIAGVKVPLRLKPRRPVSASNGRPGTLRRRGTEIELPRQGEELYGVYHFSERDGVLAAGFQTEWITVEH